MSSHKEREERILDFWKNQKIFEQSLDKNSKKEFIFYDGPPFATGLPHYGHILAGTIKDIIPRYKTMRGFHVPRRWGWDCHGLPVENLVEKELGLKTKKDIESLGIGKFNNEARESVLRYTADWKKIVPRLGRWIDMDNDYRTMDAKYTQSVWWVFKTLWNKKLIYEGFKSMHICPRCETTLSNFEVSQGYKDVTDISVYVKFRVKGSRIKNQESRNADTYLLAWTTTPWTLPGNVALAVNENIVYTEIRIGDEYFILAKDRLLAIKNEYTVLREISGKELVGLEYEPVFDYYKNESLKNKENAWKVYGASFVTTEDGTGIVHIAPAFGADDLELSVNKNLPIIQHVDMSGKFKKEIIDFAEKMVKPKEDPQSADIEIIKNLAHRGLLFTKEKITHSYAHCWRCDTPLLNYASSSWFVKVTAIKNKLVEENKKINWVPQEVGQYRFGNWLEGAKDWAISRSRFWGAPIPVWKCEKCSQVEVVGSIDELNSKVSGGNQLFLMRHGQSENNVLNILNSDLSHNHYKLTNIGIEQVKKSAKSLSGGIDVIIASPFERTKETASIVAAVVGIKESDIVIDERLREINMGVFSEKPNHEYINYFSSIAEHFTKKPDRGETYLDVRGRLSDFLNDLNKKYTDKKILVVSHDTPLWLMRACINGLSNRELQSSCGPDQKKYMSNGEIIEMELKNFPHNDLYEIDLHKPNIDSVTFDCSCGGKMKRVAEVFDCWFESGSMPYGEAGYIGERQPNFDPVGGFFRGSKGYPADFIAEGLDQTRGWFYSMLVLGVGLFGRAPFKRVIVNGIVLASDGQKMSKRLKNYPDPLDVVEKYGADALRFYLGTSPSVRGEDLRFKEEEVDEVSKKVIGRLLNVRSFLNMYGVKSDDATQSKNILDVWIYERLVETERQIAEAFESYRLDRAGSPIEIFVDDLSTWYLRRSRDRFKGSEAVQVSAVLKNVLLIFAKIIAPIMPFLAEDLFQELKTAEDVQSVHLSDWPIIKHAGVSVLQNMQIARSLVSLGLEARAKANIKVRQPLSRITYKGQALPEEFIVLIKDELNVKNVDFNIKQVDEAVLETAITEELKEEGAVRELVRHIQEKRKELGLSPNDSIAISYFSDEKGSFFMDKNKSIIMKMVQANSIDKKNIYGQAIKITDLELVLHIDKK